NFLSHFYFTKDNPDPYYSLGSVLPDLLKNHDSSIRINPEKELERLKRNHDFMSLLAGWNLHIQIDRLFHSSDFFNTESSVLRKKLVPIFTRLPIRPFFLAHVGYELTLDSLLIHNKTIDTDDFYQRIKACSTDIITEFLIECGVENPSNFSKFLD